MNCLISESARGDCELRVILPGTLEAIEELFVEIRRWTEVPAVITSVPAELLIREALTNAVIHGCHADPRKWIHCSLRFRRRTLLIVVADAGDGFDWRAQRCHCAGSSDHSGRGMEIFRKHADWVRYNDRGNVVSIVKRF